MTDRSSQQIDRYRLLRLLGQGAFGDVYLAENIYRNTEVAIKILNVRLTNEEVPAFLNEARNFRLKHPHIIPIVDFGIDPASGTPFIVMEYAPHGTLRKRHPKGTQVPLATIVRYVKQIADALQYAHEEHLVHRDVKPENMLIGRQQELLLSDFGVSVIVQTGRTSLQQSSYRVGGTPYYMAPEQFRGKPSPSSDQYALAIVVYEWLTGTPPFTEGDFIQLGYQHNFEAPPSLHEKVPGISSDVEHVIMTALAKDPQRRFASVQAFARALEQACQIAPSHQATRPTVVPLPSEPPLPSDRIAAISPSPLPLPTNVVTPPGQSFQSIVAPTPPRAPEVSPPSTGEPVPSGDPQSSKRRLSRRTVIAGITGLTVAGGGGIAWLISSRGSGSSNASRSGGPTNASTGQGQTVNINYIQYDINGVYAGLVSKFNAQNNGVHVTLNSNAPVVSDQLLTILTTMLRARSSSIDVFPMDIIWPAMFGANGWTVPLDDKWPASDRANYLPGPLQGCTYNGKLWAAPFYTDAGLIYYRTDIISTPPNTWDVLMTMANAVSPSKTKFGYLWQGAQYEGLVCDFVEVLYGYGGSVLDPNNPKSVTVNSPEGMQALTQMVSWVGTISPAAVTTYTEEVVRLAWQNGDGAFMRNWPYAYALGNDPKTSKIAGKFDVHPMLYGGSNTVGHACLGGWQYGINTFSKNPDAAWKFIQFMLSPDAQKTIALQLSLLPTLKSIYTDSDVLARYQFFSKMGPVVQTALPRPVSPFYPDISNAIQLRVHQALTKQASPAAALSALQSDLQAIVNR
jgi:multiple sugar transport system substrate-binding protein